MNDKYIYIIDNDGLEYHEVGGLGLDYNNYDNVKFNLTCFWPTAESEPGEKNIGVKCAIKHVSRPFFGTGTHHINRLRSTTSNGQNHYDHRYYHCYFYYYYGGGKFNVE